MVVIGLVLLVSDGIGYSNVLGMKLKIFQPVRFGMTGPAFPETSREPTRDHMG